MARERQYTVEDNSEAVAALVEKVGEKGFTALQEHFANWVTENAAPEFKTAKEREAFKLGAGFGLVLRMEHQRSPENHEFKAEQAAAREQEAAARPKRQPRATATEDETEEAPAPKRRGRPAKATAEAPAAPARRGRAAAAAKPATETATPARPARRAAATGAKGRARRGATKPEADF